MFIERITSSGFERTNGNLSRKIDLGIRVEKIQRAPVRWIIVELLDNPHLADSRGVTSLSRPLPINAINVSGNQDWTLWKSNIGTQAQGDSFQLNHFKVAPGNFCDVVNIGLDGS